MEQVEIFAQIVEMIFVRDNCCQIWAWDSSEYLAV